MSRNFPDGEGGWVCGKSEEQVQMPESWKRTACLQSDVQQVWGKMLGQGVVSMNPRGSAEIRAKDLVSCAWLWALP